MATKPRIFQSIKTGKKFQVIDRPAPFRPARGGKNLASAMKKMARKIV